MQFPETVTCHTGLHAHMYPRFLVWMGPDEPVPTLCSSCGEEHLPPYIDTYRTCGYCGSIHPEDLLAVLRGGAKLRVADMKYGWPHKFYVDGIPNPIAGQPCGAQHGPERKENGLSVVHLSPAPATQMAKWYNEHLLDEGFDDEARLAVIREIAIRTSVSFEITAEGRLRWSIGHLTPEEWLKQPPYAGTKIVDPDGWRSDGPYPHRDWGDRISRNEFQWRLGLSTTNMQPK